MGPGKRDGLNAGGKRGLRRSDSMSGRREKKKKGKKEFFPPATRETGERKRRLLGSPGGRDISLCLDLEGGKRKRGSKDQQGKIEGKLVMR